MADVEGARKKLLVALGEATERYWSNMKLWYKQKISKDDFDSQAFELLGPGSISLHNSFLRAILTRCQGVATTPAPSSVSNVHQKLTAGQKTTTKTIQLRKSRVRQPVDMMTAQCFEAYSNHPLTDAPLMTPTTSRNLEQEARLCSQELVLPDVATLHGRLFLGAWDAGLDSIADETAPLLVAALEIHLKNVLSACLSHKKTYQVRDGGNFRYRYGTSRTRICHQDLDQSTLDSSLGETIAARTTATGSASCLRNADEAEAESYSQLAASEPSSSVLPPISLFDLRDVLRLQPSVIPSHAVRSATMERTLATMWHPTVQEMRQSEAYVRETRTLYGKLKQRSMRV